MGGGEEGRGGCRGRGAPPGRKLNINQSIAVSPATQQRRGCGGGRGTGQERVRGKEEGGGGRESAMGGRCGEDRTRGAVEDGWQRTECRARRWPRPTGGCSRCKRAPGPGVWSSSSLWVQGAAASPSPWAHSSQRGGGSDKAGAGCLVSLRRRRPARRRRPRLPGLRVLLTAPSTFDFGDRRALASPTRRLRPPPTASAPRSNFSRCLRAPPPRGAGRPGAPRRRARGEGRFSLSAGTAAGPEQ